MKIVDFETAKLAKEKGFSIGCDWQYDEFGNIVDGLYMPHYFKAPYQYQLMDWLRGKRNICISIIPLVTMALKSKVFFTYQISSDSDGEKFNTFSSSMDSYSTHEKCLETALKEALKLIK